ncbi:MAG: sugar ABC transporter ATP-binding protein, partial [Vallitaleaceae bacterium]|nr:sugar ABC transporter ATP-binding protein [Vallitaleaceae bacterium]
MKTPLLEIKNIKLNVNNFGINDINLDLHQGEVHVIMGENGSGKSLLMQIISGFVVPDSGEIYINGQLIKLKNISALSSKDVIYIRQDVDMFENLSIAENLYFHNLPYKNKLLKVVDFEKLNFQFRQIIDELDLPVTVFDTVNTLGLAQRQILEFCKAYISNAKIVILDEPSASLSHSERELLYNIVRQIQSKGAGIFYITHRIDDVLAIGDRISIIKKGTLIGTKIVSESTEEQIIKMLSDNYIKGRYPKMHLKKGKTILSVKDLGFAGKLNNINF